MTPALLYGYVNASSSAFFEAPMTDLAKVQKLLNLTSSVNDAEALSALRLVQKLLSVNLGDYLLSAMEEAMNAGPSQTDPFKDLEKLYEAEVAKVQELKTQRDDKDKALRKRERDVMRLKRDVKALEERVAEYEKTLEAHARTAAKSLEPNQYRELEKLYEAELVKNEYLKKQLGDKDKAVKKNMRDVSRLKRGKGSGEDKVEELEKMVNDLALELMDYKDRERARKSLS